MKNIFKAAICLLLLAQGAGSTAQTVSIIPKPAQMSVQGGTLTLTADMAIAYDAACKEQAEYLLQTVRRSTGFCSPLIPAATVGARALQTPQGKNHEKPLRP